MKNNKIQSPEEFVDLNFNRGVKFKGFDGNIYQIPTDGKVSIFNYVYADHIQHTATLVHNNCKCETKMIDIWKKDVGFVEIIKEEDTNLLELIKLFPLLPTDYAKDLVVEALKVENGCLNNLANFIYEQRYLTTQYNIIPGEWSENKADYVWRTIHDFKNNIMKTHTRTQKLSRKGLKEIHAVACSGWKSSLELLGTNNPLEDYIELNQDQIDAMFKACTSSQLPIVSKYLKHDDGSVNLSGVGSLVTENGNILISKRIPGEYANKSFWLNGDYNWEIKTDSKDALCLIPTKK